MTSVISNLFGKSSIRILEDKLFFLRYETTNARFVWRNPIRLADYFMCFITTFSSSFSDPEKKLFLIVIFSWQIRTDTFATMNITQLPSIVTIFERMKAIYILQIKALLIKIIIYSFNRIQSTLNKKRYLNN